MGKYAFNPSLREPSKQGPCETCLRPADIARYRRRHLCPPCRVTFKRQVIAEQYKRRVIQRGGAT